MTTTALAASSGIISDPVLNALGRAAADGQSTFGEWLINQVVSGKSCYVPEGCCLATAVPSRLLSPKTVTVMVDLPPGTFIQASRIKFHHTQSHHPRVAASVIQWHVAPSTLEMVKPSTIISFGFVLEPEVFEGCILRQYPEIRSRPTKSTGVNPFHLCALGLVPRESFDTLIGRWNDEFVTAALGEQLAQDLDPEIAEQFRSVCPKELESDDYLDLLRYRNPQEMASASNRIFLGDYNLRGTNIPQALQGIARSLEGRKSIY